MATIKKILKWISNNFKLVLLITVIVVLSILVFWWARKNKKVRSLENQIAILNAKIKIERLEIKYDSDMQDLRELKGKDVALTKELEAIENDLSVKLAQDMTAEEIAAKFMEIGL